MRRGLLAVLGLVGCVPAFEDEPWRIEDMRVLAIVSEPPEARPGEVVQLSALVASPDGTETLAPVWSVCTRPRTSAERTGVTQPCLRGEALEPVSGSMSVLADACARFGPNPPPADGDAQPQRPSDPDSTGGYFLPVRAQVEDGSAFGAVRIRCDLPGVTRAIFEAFEDRYVANENPSFDARAPLSARVGETVELEVTTPASASEPYVRYDSERGVLVEAREWIRVQWFVTEGTLARGEATLEPTDGESPSVTSRWRAPQSAAFVHGWVVVTDARGGSAWEPFTVDVHE